MRLHLYLFPGFVIGPVVGSLLTNLAGGAGILQSNELSIAGLAIAGLFASVAFYLTDVIISGR